MPRTSHTVSRVSLHKNLCHILFWLVSIIVVSRPCLLQRTESRESENTFLPRLVRNFPTATPRGMACSPEWEVAVLDYAKNHILGDVDKFLKAFCSTSQQYVSQLWGEGGPGDIPKDWLDNDFRLDSPACGKAMGETSHPMSDKDFLRTKFVVAFSLPEQLSKGRLHFAEVVAVTLLLDRVLILPRVGGSHVNMFTPLPYCAYFDSKKLAGTVRWVTFEFHLQASLRLGKKPKVRYLCLTNGDNNCTKFGNMGRTVIPLLTITHGILANSENQFRVMSSCAEKFKMKCLSMTEERTGVNRQEHFGLLSNDDLVVVNVLTAGVTMRHLHHALFVKALNSIAYAPQVIAKAKSIANSLGPNFGAVHLRFEWMCLENVKSETDEHRVNACGDEGRKYLQRMTKKLGLSRLYVATDFSPTTLKPHKSWVAAPNCTKIVKSIVEDLNSKLNLTTWQALEPFMSDVDNGLQGIIDKLVCEEASVFIGGPGECGGKHSFDEEVVNGRLSRGRETPVFRWFHNQENM